MSRSTSGERAVCRRRKQISRVKCCLRSGTQARRRAAASSCISRFDDIVTQSDSMTIHFRAVIELVMMACDGQG